MVAELELEPAVVVDTVRTSSSLTIECLHSSSASQQLKQKTLCYKALNYCGMTRRTSEPWAKGLTITGTGRRRLAVARFCCNRLWVT